MKFVLLLLSGLSVGLLCQAQYVYTIKADSVKITNNCDSAEIIIQNHTQGVPGFLFNTGNGRTVFKRALQKLSDTTYLIGLDTLKIIQLGNIFIVNGIATYKGDYGSLFTARSIVDKGYVDSSVLHGPTLQTVTTNGNTTSSTIFANSLYSLSGVNAQQYGMYGGSNEAFAFYLLNAQSGGNTGADFALARNADGGSFIDYPLTVTRSSGLVTLLDGLKASGAITFPSLNTAGFLQTNSSGVVSTASLTSGQVTTALGFTPLSASTGVTTFNGSSGAVTYNPTWQTVLTNGASATTAPTVTLTSGNAYIAKGSTAGVNNLTDYELINDASNTGGIGIASSTYTQASHPAITANATYLTGNGLALTSQGATAVSFETNGLTRGSFASNGIFTAEYGLTASGTITLSSLNSAGFLQTNSSGVVSTAGLTGGQVTTALGYTPWYPGNDSSLLSNNGDATNLSATGLGQGIYSWLSAATNSPSSGSFGTLLNLVGNGTGQTYNGTNAWSNQLAFSTTGGFYWRQAINAGAYSSWNTIWHSGNVSAGTGIGISGTTISNTGATSFNTRTGAVTLSSSDVTTALGFTPSPASGSANYINQGTSAVNQSFNLGTGVGTATRFTGTSSSGSVLSAFLAQSSSNASYGWSSTGATTDQKDWDMYADVSGQLIGRTVNDANSTAANWMIVSRSGAVPSSVSFPELLTASGLSLTLGSDATGDVWYRNSGGNFTRLGIGTSGQVLGVSAGLPAWTTPAGGGTVTSVALTAPSGLLSVTGSPVTASGTLSLGLTNAGAFTLWGNNTASSAAPSYLSVPNALASDTGRLTSNLLTAGAGLKMIDSLAVAVSSSGSSSYIQNQNTAPQSASWNVSGTGRFANAGSSVTSGLQFEDKQGTNQAMLYLDTGNNLTIRTHLAAKILIDSLGDISTSSGGITVQRTITTSNDIDAAGKGIIGSLRGQTATLSVTKGAGMGTGGSLGATITGNNLSGLVVLTTGSTGITGGPNTLIATINLTVNFPHDVYVNLTPANNTSAGFSAIFATGQGGGAGSSDFQISTGSALQVNTVYAWYYTVTGD